MLFGTQKINSAGHLEVGGCEGTVWLADKEEKNLVAVYNSGEDAASLVGFEQPIGAGIISMVFAQQQPYCENDIGGSHGHGGRWNSSALARQMRGS